MKEEREEIEEDMEELSRLQRRTDRMEELNNLTIEELNNMVGDINDNESDFKSNIDDIEFNSLSTSCKKIYIYFILSNEDLENVSVDTFSYNSDLLHCMRSNKLISI